MISMSLLELQQANRSLAASTKSMIVQQTHQHLRFPGDHSAEY